MDKIAELLEKLAAKLGVTVEYLWPLLVKKTQIDWVASMSTSLLVLVIGIVASITSAKLFNKFFASDPGPDDMPALAMLFCGIGVICTFVGFMCTISDINNISAYFVPEAATIHNLIGMLK